MRSTAFALIIALFFSGTLSRAAEAAQAAKADRTESDAWRQVAETIPLGSRVKLQTLEGKRISGTLMRVDGDAVMVKRNTRHPEPAVIVTYDAMSKLEREQPGKDVNIGKAIAISVATGAGIVLSLMLFALQFD